MSGKWKAFLVLILVVIVGYWASLQIRSTVILGEGEEFAADVLAMMAEDDWSVDSIRRYSADWLEYSSDVSPDEFREFFVHHGDIEDIHLRGDCDDTAMDLKDREGVYVWMHCPLRVYFVAEYADLDVLLIWDGGQDEWFLYWIRNVKFYKRR